jgi:hypothetical protein
MTTLHSLLCLLVALMPVCPGRPLTDWQRNTEESLAEQAVNLWNRNTEVRTGINRNRP